MRDEPVLAVTARRLLQLGSLLLGPLSGVAALNLLETAGAPAPGRWALGTGLGTVAVGLGLAALWERAARRRYGRAHLTDDGATFERRGRPPLRLGLGQLELEEVTENGVLLARRDAGRWTRWRDPLLVPTAGQIESEALVAEVSAWRGQAHGPGSLWLRPTPLQLVPVALAALLPFVGPVASAVACGGWSWSGLVVWTLSVVDLGSWSLPLGAGVTLSAGTVALGEERHSLARVALTLAAGRWLLAHDPASGQLLAQARVSIAGAAQLQAQLGDRLALDPGDAWLRARRLHLARALALFALGTALLAAALRAGVP